MLARGARLLAGRRGQFATGAQAGLIALDGKGCRARALLVHATFVGALRHAPHRHRAGDSDRQPHAGSQQCAGTDHGAASS